MPAWKLLLLGKNFIDLYVFQCYIETCRDVWGVFGHMGGIQTYGGIQMHPKSDTPCLPLKYVIHYNPRKHQEVMHVSRIILCINN